MKKYDCERCGHRWVPRIETKPKSCPACKNRKWEEKRNTEYTKGSVEHKQKNPKTNSG